MDAIKYHFVSKIILNFENPRQNLLLLKNKVLYCLYIYTNISKEYFSIYFSKFDSLNIYIQIFLKIYIYKYF